MPKHYGTSLAQIERLSKHPRVSGKFAVEKRLWDGRKVAVWFIRSRGHLYQRGHHEIWYGTLVLDAGRDDQIGLRADDTGEVEIIHMNRAREIYDLTRRK